MDCFADLLGQQWLRSTWDLSSSSEWRCLAAASFMMLCDAFGCDLYTVWIIWLCSPVVSFDLFWGIPVVIQNILCSFHLACNSRFPDPSEPPKNQEKPGSHWKDPSKPTKLLALSCPVFFPLLHFTKCDQGQSDEACDGSLRRTNARHGRARMRFADPGNGEAEACAVKGRGRGLTSLGS